jgi:hypothetical protein
MRDDNSSDPAVLLMTALADQIADRLASRLAPQLAELVEAGGLELLSSNDKKHTGAGDPQDQVAEDRSVPDDGLWMAGRVASHYGVAVRFVYQHADELGCVRLGGGVRPRLRFDPDVVRERWPRVGGKLPESAPTRRRSSPQSEVRRRRGRPSFELLDFDREP